MSKKCPMPRCYLKSTVGASLYISFQSDDKVSINNNTLYLLENFFLVKIC